MFRGRDVHSLKKEWEKFGDMVKECINDVCGMNVLMDRQERGVNGGVKKLVWPWSNIEEPLRYSCIEEIEII